MNPQDAAFMKKFYELMEAELSNDDINVDQFADRLFVSRSKFYYKVKALTGGSPNAFFKTYKLNRAKELLDSGQYLVSEVSDMTGFSTPSVFGRNFKARFGMTRPNTWRKSSYFSSILTAKTSPLRTQRSRKASRMRETSSAAGLAFFAVYSM